jgi:hypothetical protein
MRRRLFGAASQGNGVAGRVPEVQQKVVAGKEWRGDGGIVGRREEIPLA